MLEFIRLCLGLLLPETVIRWQRKRFKEHWGRLSHSGEPGRPPISNEVKVPIRNMSSMNLAWGSPRISEVASYRPATDVGELSKLGIAIAKSTAEKYKLRVGNPAIPNRHHMCYDNVPGVHSRLPFRNKGERRTGDAAVLQGRYRPCLTFGFAWPDASRFFSVWFWSVVPAQVRMQGSRQNRFQARHR
jgi:hypothetical protein